MCNTGVFLSRSYFGRNIFTRPPPGELAEARPSPTTKASSGPSARSLARRASKWRCCQGVSPHLGAEHLGSTLRLSQESSLQGPAPGHVRRTPTLQLYAREAQNDNR